MKKYVQRADVISCGSCALDAQVGKHVQRADVISCGSRAFEASQPQEIFSARFTYFFMRAPCCSPRSAF